jgi:hypothetical protein
MPGGWRVVGATVLLSALDACSSSDPAAPTDSNDVDAATPSGATGTDADPESFYPLVDGARWTYRHTGGEMPWNEEVTLTEVTYEGDNAFVLSDSPGPSGVDSDDVLRKIGTAVLRVHKDEADQDMGGVLVASVDYDPGFTRFDYAWVQAELGFSETLSYQRTEHDAQGTLVSDQPREHKFTVEAFGERVSVPAGDFEDCMRIRRVRVRAAGEVPAEGDVMHFSVCPGIGKTQELDEVSGKMEELTGCDVPGGGCP